MRVTNPLAPHLFNRLRIQTPAGLSVERIGAESTYVHQLRAFVGVVRGGERLPSDAANGLANMRLVDEIYRRAGLRPRGP